MNARFCRPCLGFALAAWVLVAPTAAQAFMDYVDISYFSAQTSVGLDAYVNGIEKEFKNLDVSYTHEGNGTGFVAHSEVRGWLGLELASYDMGQGFVDSSEERAQPPGSINYSGSHAYLTANFPARNRMDTSGLQFVLKYGFVSIDAATDLRNFTQLSQSGASYGAGLVFTGSSGLLLALDYAKHAEKIETTGLRLGYRYNLFNRRQAARRLASNFGGNSELARLQGLGQSGGSRGRGGSDGANGQLSQTQAQIGMAMSATQDSDGDGVPDSMDKCLNSVTGASVNSDGCLVSVSSLGQSGMLAMGAPVARGMNIGGATEEDEANSAYDVRVNGGRGQVRTQGGGSARSIDEQLQLLNISVASDAEFIDVMGVDPISLHTGSDIQAVNRRHLEFILGSNIAYTDANFTNPDDTYEDYVRAQQRIDANQANDPNIQRLKQQTRAQVSSEVSQYVQQQRRNVLLEESDIGAAREGLSQISLQVDNRAADNNAPPSPAAQRIVHQPLFFSPGSAEFGGAGRQNLNTLASILQNNPRMVAEMRIWSDPNLDDGTAIAEEQRSAVREYLIGLGVDANQIAFYTGTYIPESAERANQIWFNLAN